MFKFVYNWLRSFFGIGVSEASVPLYADRTPALSRFHRIHIPIEYGSDIAVLYQALDQFTAHYVKTGNLEASRQIATSYAATMLYQQFPNEKFEIVAEGGGHRYMRPPPRLMPLFSAIRQGLENHAEYLELHHQLTQDSKSKNSTPVDIRSIGTSSILLVAASATTNATVNTVVRKLTAS